MLKLSTKTTYSEIIEWIIAIAFLTFFFGTFLLGAWLDQW